MWSLVLVTVVPWASLDVLGEVGTYTAFNQCVYAQHITQPSVSAKDPNGFLLCIKDFKHTTRAEE